MQESTNSSVSAPVPMAPTEEVQKKDYFESDAGDGTKRQDMYFQGFTLFLCIASAFLCMFLFALDQLIVATILSTVGNKFHATNQIGWLTSGFLISMAVLVAVWGKLAIIFGRKSTMIAAIILFEAGSLMCALSNSMNVLIGGRVLAGIGGGGIQTLVFILITEVLPMQKRPLGMALLGCVFAISSVLGPLIGGAFTSKVSWRWCFYINLPIGAVALVIFFFSFNPPRVKTSIKDKLRLIDYFGVFLMTAGLVLLLLALTFGSSGDHGWGSTSVILCFVLGGLLMVAFSVWNFIFSKHPLIPLDVVQSFQTVAAAIALFGGFSFFISSILYLSIYFQVIHGASAWKSGVDLLPCIIAVAITSTATGILVKKTTFVKPFTIFGCCCGMIGMGLLTLLEVDSKQAQKVGYLILGGVGIGSIMQSSIIAGQITAPKTPGGVLMATTFMNFCRTFGGAVAGALSDTVYTTTFVNNIDKDTAKQSTAIIEELSNYDLKAIIKRTDLIKSMSPEANLFIKQELMKCIRNTFYMNLGFAAIAVLASIFLTNQRLPEEIEQNKEMKAVEQAEAVEPVEQDEDESDESKLSKESKEAPQLKETRAS